MKNHIYAVHEGNRDYDCEQWFNHVHEGRKKIWRKCEFCEETKIIHATLVVNSMFMEVKFQKLMLIIFQKLKILEFVVTNEMLLV